jgi:hypothetical protein
MFKDTLHMSEHIEQPRYPDHPSIKTNCKMTADLRKVDKAKFEREVGHDGKRYDIIDYDLVVTLQPAVMKFSLEIDGEEMGSVAAKYE